MKAMEAKNEETLAKNETAIGGLQTSFERLQTSFEKLRTDMEKNVNTITIRVIGVVGLGIALLAIILK